MKKPMIIFCALTLLLFSACGGTGSDESVEETVSGEVSEMISISVPQSSTEESKEESKLPDGISEEKKGFLRFTSYSGRVSAVFPEMFQTLCQGYTPTDGIYLQTSDGKATLQLEYVDNEGITKNDLSDYLKQTYPGANVFINDDKNVICKTTIKDSQKNTVCCYLKAIVDSEGYREAILFFKEADKKTYETIFNQITL